MTLGGFIPSGEQTQNAANTRLVSAMSPSAVIDFHPAPVRIAGRKSIN